MNYTIEGFLNGAQVDTATGTLTTIASIPGAASSDECLAASPANPHPRAVALGPGTQLTWPKPGDDTASLRAAVLLITELATQNFTEAALAIQTVATAEAALMFLHRATIPEQPTENIDRNVARASRLMRLHVEQIEAMQKLKGKAGQQKVTVEHVHVYEGGQAIVGAVSTTKGREGGNSDAESNTPR